MWILYNTRKSAISSNMKEDIPMKKILALILACLMALCSFAAVAEEAPVKLGQVQ